MCLLPSIPRLRLALAICCRYFCQCLQGYWFLIVLLAYQLLNFIVVLSLSIGIAAFFSFMNDFCWNHGLSSDAQTVIMLCFLAMSAECTLILKQDSRVGVWFKEKSIRHPFIVGRIPTILYAWGFLLACSQLFIQYKIAHPSIFFSPDGLTKSEKSRQDGSLDQTATFFYLFSLTYIAYITSRFSDWIRYRCRLSLHDRYGRIGSCGAYIFYLWLQLVLLCLYGVPIFIAAAMCRYSTISPHTTFMVINFGAVVIGFNVVQIESSRPFPTVSLLPPDFRYESHLCARVNLLQLLLYPLVAVGYYSPGRTFSAMKPEDKFILYTIFVGMATLQATKILFDVRYVDAIRRLRLRRQAQPRNDAFPGAEPNPEAQLALANAPENVPCPVVQSNPAQNDIVNQNNVVPGPSGSTSVNEKQENSPQPTTDPNQNVVRDFGIDSVEKNSTHLSFCTNPDKNSFIVELEE